MPKHQVDKKHIEHALRGLLTTSAQTAEAQVTYATAVQKAEIERDITSGLEAHAAQHTGTHGLAPGYYFAKTTRPDGRVALKDIVGEWDLSQFDIDWSTIRLDAGLCFDRGVVKIMYLPVAAWGEQSSQKLVRSDDPRLGSDAFVLPTYEPISSGEWISLIDDAGTTKARRAEANHSGGAVGFAGGSVGAGDDLSVFTTGENALCSMPDTTGMTVGQLVYLGSTAGRASVNPASGTGELIQSLGTVIEIVSATIVRLLVRIDTGGVGGGASGATGAVEQATVFESLAAGDLVTLFDNAGVRSVQKASALDASKPVHGFVLSAYNIGSSADVYLAGLNSEVPLGGFTNNNVGAPVFLSASTPGAVTLTPPNTVIQRVGTLVGLGTTARVQVEPGLVIVL